MNDKERKAMYAKLKIGDTVKILNGNFNGYGGKLKEITPDGSVRIINPHGGGDFKSKIDNIKKAKLNIYHVNGTEINAFSKKDAISAITGDMR